MNNYIVVLAACVLVLQVEVFALLLLDKYNLGVWCAQTALNGQLVNAETAQCAL